MDPFEKSRTGSLNGIFDKCSLQLQTDIGKKLFGQSYRIPEERGLSRRIIQAWPRNPSGECCTMADLRGLSVGYRTPNSTDLWGSTIFDFYLFQTNPGAFGATLGISTGAKLSAWMKAHGELDYAKDCMEKVAMERGPRLRPAADIMEIANARDLAIMMGSCGIPMGAHDNEWWDGEELEDTVPPLSAVVPFDYQNYPAPWPLVPFSSNPPSLQSPIALHLLPETLIVHDPFHLLCNTAVDSEDTDWTSVNDDTYRYRLSLTENSVREAIATERAKTAQIPRTEPVQIGVLLDRFDAARLEETSASSGKAYRVTVPPPPVSPSSIPEAHLFISPAELVGTGNHSRVYRAEWDLPRSVFSEPKICKICVENAALDILEQKSAKGAKKSDEMEDIILQKRRIVPGLDLNFKAWNTEDDKIAHVRAREEQALQYLDYAGIIDTVLVDSVPWYVDGPPLCSHLEQSFVSGPLPGPTPPTVQVSVIAKLSVPEDGHLEREAVNYQRFGPEFSQHWTGYNLALPIRDPTPTGAITPTFYGYYTKEETADADTGKEGGTTKDSRYFSPILLLEDCGKPIEVSQLDLDDRQECAALILRLHHLGWTQGSFWPRNIVMQLGDHGDFPLMRSSKDRRFRLIDFGRAECRRDAVEADRLRGDGKHRKTEEWERVRNDEKRSVWEVLDFPHPY
ncbi:hypothetical protein GYMLUDRAFT_35141 [Collybiopsis luxurians FD-317 M1]|nr:hypothetical protein GYMLUDRAFT_35141 [Collybiopsis luxurians FD-317 M1]